MRLRIPCIAATIQRFEFSYELSDKMPERYLEMAAPNPARIDEMVFHDMIRTASEQGFVAQRLGSLERLPPGAQHQQRRL